MIEYVLPGSGPVEVSLHNLFGQRVRRLVHGRVQGGAHSVVWDGRDGQGRRVSTGVYLCQLRFGGMRRTRKLLVIR